MIPAVILAAGRSTRMGQPKALLSLGGSETFLTRIIRTFEAAAVEDVVVVLGHEADAIVESVTRVGLRPRFVVNKDFDKGQLSSMVAGVRAIDRPGVIAMLLTLVDVPFVTAATVRSVAARYRATHAPIVRPVKGALHGHPVLIDRTLFERLRAADPEAGAKPVVRAHVSEAGNVPIEDEGAYFDIDTPEEYARAMERFGRVPE
jgi:molybdenum cofactor cytidylyltransferase